LLYIDLDGFKAVNDSLGHDGGDRLLESIGRTLAAVLRRDQYAYRVGGDEFVILAEGAGIEEASRLAGRTIAAIAARQGIAIRAGCRISASIGIALACTDGSDPHALLAEADAALYFAKRQGKSCFHLYGTEEMPLLHAC
jgi:diguanylate cyclase (GGDEF)-like protein